MSRSTFKALLQLTPSDTGTVEIFSSPLGNLQVGSGKMDLCSVVLLTKIRNKFTLKHKPRGSAFLLGAEKYLQDNSVPSGLSVHPQLGTGIKLAQIIAVITTNHVQGHVPENEDDGEHRPCRPLLDIFDVGVVAWGDIERTWCRTCCLHGCR